jgi:hypothetical protein
MTGVDLKPGKEPCLVGYDVKSGQLRRFAIDQTRWVVCIACKRERPPHAVRVEAFSMLDAGANPRLDDDMLVSTPFWCWNCYERDKPGGAVTIQHLEPRPA